MVQDLQINDRLVIPAAELQWRFARASGPGGQGVNTTDSKVELRFDLERSQTDFVEEWRAMLIQERRV